MVRTHGPMDLGFGSRSGGSPCEGSPCQATSCTSVTVPGSLEFSRLRRDLPELRLTSQPRRVFASYNPGCRQNLL
ncbi:hypothetical protein SKAU_G00191240 [Synaphobranchus kaupii]|uniref:Uncharacterized protein n=1 Tax=Synaphobranchus kaupii TaxID=118154 RepID=A0A9Q1FE22_SYNKA|nr:hypothetical protein SKAU_G00191240 [Synaphobranchus kaupii]